MELNMKTNKELNSEVKESVKEENWSFNSIPVKIGRQGDNLKILFLLHAQYYTMKVTENNKGEFKLLKEALKKNRKVVVKVFLKKGTSEIIKVEKGSIEDYKKIWSIYTTKMEADGSNLTDIIPDLKTLNILFETIRNEACVGIGMYENGCIPFRYPVDGCYARAHKMRQILAKNGYDCQKQFVYGNLRAKNKRKTCCVNWGYHVAVLVKYKDETGTVQKKIIDVSLSDKGPMTESEWHTACTDSTCGKTFINSYVNTPGNVYYRSPKGQVFLYDNNYRNTDCVLKVFQWLKDCTPTPAPDVSYCPF